MIIIIKSKKNFNLKQIFLKIGNNAMNNYSNSKFKIYLIFKMKIRFKIMIKYKKLSNKQKVKNKNNNKINKIKRKKKIWFLVVMKNRNFK